MNIHMCMHIYERVPIYVHVYIVCMHCILACSMSCVLMIGNCNQVRVQYSVSSHSSVPLHVYTVYVHV